MRPTLALFALLAPALAAAAPAAPEPDPRLLERARALLVRAPLIDTHNDLPSMLLEKAGGDLAKVDLARVQPGYCADFPRLREGGVGVQYWSVYVDASLRHSRTALHEALREVDQIAGIAARWPAEAELARSADEIERIHRAGKLAMLFGVEGGHIIEGSPAALRALHALGARYLTLTHWDTLSWADAATDRPGNDGLSKWGEKLVRELNRLGIFADLSHVSPDTMRDVLRVTRAPVIFSHSDAAALAGHARNVPDDVIAQLPRNGGVLHLSFIAAFVARGDGAWQARATAARRELRAAVATEEELAKALEEWKKKNPYPQPSIAELADHVDHVRKLAGIDHLGIGADFFGVNPDELVAGLDGPSRYPLLFAELLRRGYSEEDLMKIAGRNHLRALRQVEKVAAELQRTEPPLVEEAPAGAK